MINRENKKNIVVSLGTGHGKSVVIQLLADILSNLGFEVMIVTLNNFLAHWGRKNYGSINVKGDRVMYIGVKSFMKREPDSNIIVIYD